jgi:excisionase family DNA binding protein
MHTLSEVIEQRLTNIELQLSNINTYLKGNNCQEDTIGINEVAKILHVSKDTIYTKTHKKLIPHKKQGKILLFSRKEILAHLDMGKVKTIHQEIHENENVLQLKLSRKKQQNFV